MMRNFGIGILALVGLIYGYINYIAYPTFYFNYKLTVEVQTPDGVKSASVVNQEHYAFYMFGREFLSNAGGGLSKGEALFLDLGFGKNLVVTNYADDKRPGSQVTRIMGDVSTSKSNDDMSWDSAELVSPMCDLPGAPQPCFGHIRGVRWALANARKFGPFAVNIAHLPTLLTFSDPADYKTMRRVDPEHLESVFGPGFAIKSVTVEITDEPVTEKIESQLPWLSQYRAITQTFTKNGLNIESSKHSYVTFKEPSKS